MDRDVTTNFYIDEGVTYTIGIRDAWKTDRNMDSIASSAYIKNLPHDNNIINKIGSGTLLMHGRMSDYYGTVNVNAGTFQVTSDWDIANTVTVNGGILALENFSFTNVKTAAAYDGSAGDSADDIVDDKGSILFGNNGGQVIITGNKFDLSEIALTPNARVTFSGQTFNTAQANNQPLISIPSNNLQGGTLELQGVKISNQASVRGSGVLLNGGNNQKGSSLIVEDSEFNNNSATMRGSAIEVNNAAWAVNNKASVNITNSVFSGNTANSTSDYLGGAIFIRGADTNFVNAIFRGNSVKSAVGYAEGGGAVYVVGWGQNRTFTQTGGAYEGNSVIATGNLSKMTQQSLGGAAITVKGMDATFTDVLFTNNVVDYSGTDGKAAATGGAIAADYSTGSVVSGNTKGMAASVKIVATQDMAYTGNTIKSSSSQETLFHNYGYASPMKAGGFLMLQRGSTAEFEVAEGKTLTLGVAGSRDKDADSIASDLPTTSKFNTSDGVSTLTKSGKGTLLVNSTLNKYFGTTTVAEGTLQVSSDWTAGNDISVKKGASLQTGALTLTSLASAFTAQTNTEAASSLHNDIKDKKAKLAVEEGANVTLSSLTLTNSTAAEVAGNLTVTGKLDAQGGTFTLKGGKLSTAISNVFTDGTLDESTIKSVAKGVTVTGGTLAFTNEGEYTYSLLSKMNEVGGSSITNATYEFTNASLKVVDDDIQDGKLDIPVDTITESLDVPTAGTEVSVSNNLTLTATEGEENQKLAGEAAKLTVAANKTLTVGEDAFKPTTALLPVVSVADMGKFAVKGLILSVEALEGSGIITVGSSASDRAALTIRKLLSSGVIFVDPAWKNDEALDVIGNASHLGISEVADGKLNAKVISGRNALVAYGASAETAEQAFEKLSAKNDISWGPKDVTSALYLGAALKFGTSGGVLVQGGDANGQNAASAQSTVATGGLTVENKGLLMINQEALGGAAAVDGSVALAEGSTVALVNATGDDQVLATGTLSDHGAKVLTDNEFITAEVNQAAGTIAVDVKEAQFAGAIASMGLQAMAHRADNVMADAIADRTSARLPAQAGLGLWVAAGGESYKADDLGNGAKFKSDMGYAVFGGDVAVTDAARIGAAVHYGTGTLRSGSYGIRNEVDSVGFTLYGAYNVTDAARVVGEVSWLRSSNDVTSRTNAKLANDTDVDVLSAGIRGEHAFTAGAWEFVPSIGLRLSRISTDDFSVGALETKFDDQTLVELPVAFRVSTQAFESAGWAVKPYARVAYTPVFGDTEATVRGYEQDAFASSTFEGALGVEAAYGNFSAKVSFTGGCGDKETSVIGGKLNLSYAF